MLIAFELEMSDTTAIKETFLNSVVGGIYDSIDLSTKQALCKLEEQKFLERAYANIGQETQRQRSQLSASPPIPEQQPIARLSDDQENHAENLRRCLNMCSRLTACPIDPQGRLTCGGVVLKDSTTFDGLQANWDLIDTVTDADA